MCLGTVDSVRDMCAAYDFFPCQFQLWYRAKGKGVVWYDPIFKVYTLDGREVWLRRHYRVRRAKTPGAFYFSVLDNGVTSKYATACVSVLLSFFSRVILQLTTAEVNRAHIYTQHLQQHSSTQMKAVPSDYVCTDLLLMNTMWWFLYSST